ATGKTMEPGSFSPEKTAIAPPASRLFSPRFPGVHDFETQLDENEYADPGKYHTAAEEFLRVLFRRAFFRRRPQVQKKGHSAVAVAGSL
ncbi:MAG: hypothetical protein IKP09_01395, partial [Lentisphaeria bacterium]|nr:hypothetical protein [Lentisphaeria bacterium]